MALAPKITLASTCRWPGTGSLTERGPGERLHHASRRDVLLAIPGAQRPRRPEVGRQCRDVIAGDRETRASLRAVGCEAAEHRDGISFGGGVEEADIPVLAGRAGQEVEDRPVMPDPEPPRRLPRHNVSNQPLNLLRLLTEAILRVPQPVAEMSSTVTSRNPRSSSAPARRDAPPPTSIRLSLAVTPAASSIVRDIRGRAWNQLREASPPA